VIFALFSKANKSMALFRNTLYTTCCKIRAFRQLVVRGCP